MALVLYETSMAMWPCVLAHTHFIRHAFGWQEGGLVTSFEKVVMDAELVQHMVEFMKPIEVNEEEMGIVAIEEVGPGGHFFGSQHTLDRYEGAFYQPFLSAFPIRLADLRGLERGWRARHACPRKPHLEAVAGGLRGTTSRPGSRGCTGRLCRAAY